MIADRPARQADQNPGSGCLVGDPQTLPLLHPRSQRDQRFPRFLARHQERTLGTCRHRRDGAANGGRDRFEFVHRGPGPVELADREGDLHVSGQQAGATQRLRRLPGGTPDRGGGGIRFALHQA